MTRRPHIHLRGGAILAAVTRPQIAASLLAAVMGCGLPSPATPDAAADTLRGGSDTALVVPSPDAFAVDVALPDVGSPADVPPSIDAGVADAPSGPDVGVTTTVFPADRLIAWRGNVGVEGGIPARTVIRDCVVSDRVPTDGTTDATAAIRACLAATPLDGVAFLPAGTYRITGRVAIPSRKTLRGAGATTTIFTRSVIDDLLYVGSGTSANPLVPVTAGATRGSTSLTLADAAALSGGDYVLINELNDPAIPVSPQSYADGRCNWCDQFGATRLRGQVARVTARAGNTITISPPFFYDFAPSRSPRVMRLNRPTEYAGIEDLVVRNDPSATGGWNTNIKFEGAANSWVRNVRVDTCGRRCIDARTYYYRLEIRDSRIEHCLNHADSDHCYGTQLAEGSSALVENNVYNDTSNGPILMWGASGNVVSYNYLNAVFRTRNRASWFWPSSWTHGAHPSFNLWEGNVMAGLNWDGYWGSASHNVAFRNRLTSHDPAQGLTPGHVETAALIIETDNHYMSAVGNVLGEAGWTNAYEQQGTRNWGEHLIYALGTGAPGNDPRCFSTMFRHMNYDYSTRGTRRCGTMGEPPCQGGDAAAALPASLYLGARPAWFGTVAFPPIDPAAPTVADLPARRRFAAGM